MVNKRTSPPSSLSTCITTLAKNSRMVMAFSGFSWLLCRANGTFGDDGTASISPFRFLLEGSDGASSQRAELSHR